MILLFLLFYTPDEHSSLTVYAFPVHLVFHLETPEREGVDFELNLNAEIMTLLRQYEWDHNLHLDLGKDDVNAFFRARICKSSF